MAYFAKLNDNNEVIDLVVVDDNAITDKGVQKEQLGIDFLATITNHNKWVQTFIDGSKRKNYASIGGFYDPVDDAFIAKQPFPSWKLNKETYQWEAPVKREFEPGVYYVWKETELNWVPQIVPPLDISR